jgi:sporulation protein YhbH
MNASVSHNPDWKLSRKGLMDQQRHKEKIKEALKENLPEILSNEDIILGDGNKVLRVPVRVRNLPKFRFTEGEKAEGVGQGSGGSKVGDVVGQAGDQSGQGPQAGSEPGTDYYETDITLDELAALIFEDLGLPNLEDKRAAHIEAESVKFTDIRKTGIMGNLDKRRTIRENIKRNAATTGKAEFKDIRTEDLRFKTWEVETKPESNAVILAMMDVSGSMGEFEKYIARTFYFWMVRFLRTKYQNVEIVFISHHTEAKEVTEHEFFHKGESGGTKVSSVYQLALEIIEQRYSPADWNIYPFHFSDGDNMFSDNALCVDLINLLIAVSQMVGYGQIKQGWYPAGTLGAVYSREIENPKFRQVTIQEKEDVYPALQKFFGKEQVEAAAAK